MYGAMLERVIDVINHTVGRRRTPNEEFTAFSESLFAPELYVKRLEKERAREDLSWKLIAGATLLAAAGEVYHVAKRSNVFRNLKK